MSEKCLIDPTRDCLGLAQSTILEKRIKDLEDWKINSSKFHESFYDYQREQIARDARLDEQLKSMNTNITKLVTWQESQVKKSGLRWDSIVDKILLAVVGAIVVYIMTQVGF